MIRSAYITRSAKGEPCTLNVAGVCNGNPETTVFAHFRWLGDCGIGIKPSDIQGAYSCSACHDWLDGRRQHVEETYASDRNFYAARAQARTINRLVEKGILQIRSAA